MNVLCIFLCFYVAVSAMIEWFTSSDFFENSHGRNTSDITCRSPTRYKYNRDQLLNIGLTVSKNRRLGQLGPEAYSIINLHNINRKKKTHRSKRGGKKKIIPIQNGVNFNNLIYPKKLNQYKNVSEHVSCITLNCRSVVNKDHFVGQYLREEKIDFALLTETWYTDEKQHQFETSDLNQNGYKLSVTNRKNQKGGGVAITCRNTINMRRVTNGTVRSFEYGIWKLVFKSLTVHVVGVYRPPALSTCNQFVVEFFDFIENILPHYKNLLIMGDFNLHINNDTNDIKKLQRLSSSNRSGTTC